jgi:hypothetical protein
MIEPGKIHIGCTVIPHRTWAAGKNYSLYLCGKGWKMVERMYLAIHV